VQEHSDGPTKHQVPNHHVQTVLAKLSLCRTSALGGRWYECQDCSEITKLHNSCGDRHCPGCGGAKRLDWSDRAEKLLIDGVEYYQVVFTLPKDLSTLALGNRLDMADLLFQSAWKAINKSIRTEQGYESAALMVLHSWNQKLDAHWHVHALVPAAGPSITDGSWTKATSPQISDEAEDDVARDRKYLVDATNLRNNFRSFAMRHLKRLRHQDKLSYGGSLSHLTDEDQWESFTTDLEAITWAVHIQPPPRDSSQPEHVVRYLTRYMTGGPISDHRIIAADEHNVTILARDGNTTGGNRQQVPVIIPTAEFVRRWCLHIQPDQLTKTRQMGGWSNTKKEAYLSKCHAALATAGLNTQPIDLDDPTDFPFGANLPKESTTNSHDILCQHCSSHRIRLIAEHAQPSWSALFHLASPYLPAWYGQSLEAAQRAWWDARMGAGFSDWYDENLKPPIESARGSASPPKPLASQPHLPGLCQPGGIETSNYALASV